MNRSYDEMSLHDLKEESSTNLRNYLRAYKIKVSVAVRPKMDRTGKPIGRTGSWQLTREYLAKLIHYFIHRMRDNKAGRKKITDSEDDRLRGKRIDYWKIAHSDDDDFNPGRAEYYRERIVSPREQALQDKLAKQRAKKRQARSTARQVRETVDKLTAERNELQRQYSHEIAHLKASHNLTRQEAQQMRNDLSDARRETLRLRVITETARKARERAAEIERKRKADERRRKARARLIRPRIPVRPGMTQKEALVDPNSGVQIRGGKILAPEFDTEEKRAKWRQDRRSRQPFASTFAQWYNDKLSFDWGNQDHPTDLKLRKYAKQWLALSPEERRKATVKQLKNWIKTFGGRPSGRKADLITQATTLAKYFRRVGRR